ncbi:hypothetical protein BJ878DRAFT_281289 [Calycina marina]|uniref:Uncharacterized protein n=1 Tax=Calycina marina TaxID=1763456 RepID=A0A9P8CH67_9HELO|nr:hypothetical protein BJ878DRAFT_281289 [Calycina marina]
MSRSYQVFTGLFLATAFGVANGIAVFGPSLKQQKEERENEARRSEAVFALEDDKVMKSIGAVEAASSRSLATEKVLRADSQSKSWWTTVNPWSNVGVSASPPIGSTDTNIDETHIQPPQEQVQELGTKIIYHHKRTRDDK